MIIHPDIPSPHKDADQGLREIAHIHHIDHSLHVILSPADSKTGALFFHLSMRPHLNMKLSAIDLGWAERHPLSGVSSFLPLPNSYLLVYAPRDEEELDIVEHIIVASIGYMTGSHSVA
jgi:ureidoglycolate hydrolase